MAYTNSKLISLTRISANRNSPRNHAIDRVSIHCVVGQLSIETMANMFAPSNYAASCNYCIGTDGRMALIVEEKDRSWCTSSPENDNRAVTIECANDLTHPYAVNAKVYASLVELLVDICQRNGKKKLLWFADKQKTLAYSPAQDEMVMTVHRWFAAKACPGDYLYNLHGQIAAEVTAKLGGTAATPAEPQKIYRVRISWKDAASQLGAFENLDLAKAEADRNPGYNVYDWNGKLVHEGKKVTGFQASSLAGLTNAERIAAMAPLYQECERKTGMLTSVALAQFALESGYGTTDLAVKANNLHGMKCSLSGNTWEGSTWDGVSKYGKNSPENVGGTTVMKYSEFRKYACCEDSIADRAAYFVGAKDGNALRYPGIAQMKDYKQQIKAIKAGGYATDPDYVNKLIGIVETYNLTQYDVMENVTPAEPATPVTPPESEKQWYRVRKTWKKADTQLGAYENLELAIACADAHDGYKVYDHKGKVVYTPDKAHFPYQVRVTVPDLRIRKKPTTDALSKGAILPGVYTITREKKADGYTWGKLQSGAGWIALEYTEKI